MTLIATLGRESKRSRRPITRADLKCDLFTSDIDQAAQARAKAIDGKLLLVSNVPDMSAHEIVARYKSLADIEHGFHVLKSEIEIAPMFHWLPERIRAHASICLMALVIHRFMRQRLKLADSTLSPEAALRQLRRDQLHQVRIDGAGHVAGISTIHQDQAIGAAKTSTSWQIIAGKHRRGLDASTVYTSPFTTIAYRNFGNHNGGRTS